MLGCSLFIASLYLGHQLHYYLRTLLFSVALASYRCVLALRCILSVVKRYITLYS